MRVLFIAVLLLVGCGQSPQTRSLKDDLEFQELKKKVATLELKKIDEMVIMEGLNSKEERLLRLAKKVEAIRAYLEDQQKNTQSSSPRQLPRGSELFPEKPL